MKKVIFILFLFLVGLNLIAQKNYIRNGSFEEMEEENELNKSYYPVKYWSKYKIDNINQFISKRQRNLVVITCPAASFDEKSTGIKGINGKYSAFIATKNIETSPLFPNNDVEITYIYNYLKSIKQSKNYTLTFRAHILQKKDKIYSYHKLDEGGGILFGKCDTCYCDTLANDSIKLTLLFTNVLPEGRLYKPQKDDVFLDTLLSNCCEKGNDFSFDFFLNKKYKYFVIGYLPREVKKGRRVCYHFFEAVFDDFELNVNNFGK